MNSFIEKATLSILTVSCLSLALPPQSQAFTSQLKSAIPITNQTIFRPQPEVDLSQSQVSKGELVAFNWQDAKAVGKIVGEPLGSWIKDKITNSPNSENQQR
jgi:hypothetical protein